MYADFDEINNALSHYNLGEMKILCIQKGLFLASVQNIYTKEVHGAEITSYPDLSPAGNKPEDFKEIVQKELDNIRNYVTDDNIDLSSDLTLSEIYVIRVFKSNLTNLYEIIKYCRSGLSEGFIRYIVQQILAKMQVFFDNEIIFFKLSAESVIINREGRVIRPDQVSLQFYFKESLSNYNHPKSSLLPSQYDHRHHLNSLGQLIIQMCFGIVYPNISPLNLHSVEDFPSLFKSTGYSSDLVEFVSRCFDVTHCPKLQFYELLSHRFVTNPPVVNPYDHLFNNIHKITLCFSQMQTMDQNNIVSSILCHTNIFFNLYSYFTSNISQIPADLLALYNMQTYFSNVANTNQISVQNIGGQIANMPADPQHGPPLQVGDFRTINSSTADYDSKLTIEHGDWGSSDDNRDVGWNTINTEINNNTQASGVFNSGNISCSGNDNCTINTDMYGSGGFSKSDDLMIFPRSEKSSDYSSHENLSESEHTLSISILSSPASDGLNTPKLSRINSSNSSGSLDSLDSQSYINDIVHQRSIKRHINMPNQVGSKKFKCNKNCGDQTSTICGNLDITNHITSIILKYQQFDPSINLSMIDITYVHRQHLTSRDKAANFKRNDFPKSRFQRAV